MGKDEVIETDIYTEGEEWRAYDQFVSPITSTFRIYKFLQQTKHIILTSLP